MEIKYLSHSSRQGIILFIIFLVAFFLRLDKVHLHVLAHDEMISWLELVSNVYHDCHPPLPIWVYQFTTWITGEQSLFMLRATGCFFGALAVVAIFFLAKLMTKSEKWAYAVALTFMFLPLQVY